MFIWKGATYCETCQDKKRVIIIGGTPMHVEKDGTLKFLPGHKIFVGGR